MAEGWARHLMSPVIESYSAGIDTKPLDPRAVLVMAETGVDISQHRSKYVDEVSDIAFDYVITVCGHANENCPVFPGATKVIHVGFDDPPRQAQGGATETAALEPYRRVRDQIRTFIETLPEGLNMEKEKT